MKTGRLGIALVMALVVSLVVTYVLYGHIKKQFEGAQLIKVVVAAKPMETGTPIAATDLTTMDWPANAPLDGVFHKPEELNGRIARFPIAFKEPIREGLLAAPGATVGLTAKIPDGMRAVAVVTNEVNNVSGFLFPGSHVDVLVSFRPDNSNATPITSTVLQNIEVLSTGERLQPDPSGKPQNVKVVTLLLNPDDAEKLLLASNQGTVQFVLRNASDDAKPVTKPASLKDLQGSGPAGPVVAKRAAPAAPKPPNQYEVDTYDGAKKSSVKF
jgi:pilus assembly protein CpaB